MYCATTISKPGKGGTRNSFFNTVEELRQFIFDHCYENVYHACSTYCVQGSRKQENVKYIRALWLDIDIGRKGGYDTVIEAIEAVRSFCKRIRIPNPMVILTGGGLHLYWPLNRDVTEQEWLPYARGLKRACETRGLRVDPSRTSDSSSVLRPIETINPKYHENNTVQLALDCPQYDLSVFSVFVLSQDKPAEKKEYALVDVQPILEGCHQMHSFAMGVHQSEPVWRSCGVILSKCKKGEELWHAFSKQDPRYDEEEANTKWKGISQFDSAITCQWFKSHNPEGCNGCILNIKTPVQLTRNTNSIVLDDIELPKLPSPYGFNKEHKLVLYKARENEEVEEMVLSDVPILVEHVYRAETQDDKYNLGIKVYRSRKGWTHHLVSPAEYNSNAPATFSQCNIPYLKSKELVTYMNVMHNYIRDKQQELSYETFGWKGDGFLLGDKLLYLKDGKACERTVSLTGEAVTIARSLRKGGRRGAHPDGLRRWREAAQSLFARGHEWQAATLLTSFAALLLAFSPDAEGGVIWSLASTEGGTGKSTATIAAASVWGDFDALNCTPGDTLNARFAKIATLGNIPTFFDEQSRDSPKIANDFVKSFTVGREKERLNRAGELAREPRHWKTILISNANIELAGSIRADNGSDAMADRVLEISVEGLPLNKKELSNDIKNTFLENPGYAGPIFVFLCLSNMDWIRRELVHKMKEYNSNLGSTKDRFLAAHLAAFDVACRLIEASELLTINAEERIKWMLEQVRGYTVEERAPKITNEDLLSAYFRENISKTLVTRSFVPRTILSAVRHPMHELKIRVETDTGEIATTRKHIDEFLAKKNRSTREFVRDLEKKGIIKHKNHKKCLGAGFKEYASGQEYCLIFDSNHPSLNQELMEQLIAPEHGLALPKP